MNPGSSLREISPLFRRLRKMIISGIPCEMI